MTALFTVLSLLVFAVVRCDGGVDARNEATATIEVSQTAQREYVYNNEAVPLARLYRRCMHKEVFKLLDGMVRAVVADRTLQKETGGFQLRHGKARRSCRWMSITLLYQSCLVLFVDAVRSVPCCVWQCAVFLPHVGCCAGSDLLCRTPGCTCLAGEWTELRVSLSFVSRSRSLFPSCAGLHVLVPEGTNPACIDPRRVGYCLVVQACVRQHVEACARQYRRGGVVGATPRGVPRYQFPLR